MQVKPSRFLISLSIGITAISFGSIFVRFTQAEGVPALSIAAWRLFFASLIVWPYAWMTRRDELRALSRREVVLLIASGVFLALHFATWIASLAHTSVASSVVLVSMGPLFVGLGSWLFLRERPTLPMLAGILLAALGSIIISWGDFGAGKDHLWGDLLALTGAVMVAGYLMIGRKIRVSRSLITYIAVVYGVSMLTLLLLVILTRRPMLGFTPAAYGWMVTLAIVPQLIGHSTFNWALRHLSATYVALLTLAEPIGASLLAYLILGEGVTISTFAGGLLILVGITLGTRGESA